MGSFFLYTLSEIKVKFIKIVDLKLNLKLYYCKNSLIEYNKNNLSTVYKHHQLDDFNGRETKSLEFCIRRDRA